MPKPLIKKYKIDQTFFSDGTRIIKVTYGSYEGERELINLIEEKLKSMGLES